MIENVYAELLVDTARMPSGLGTRAASVADRQLVFRHGGFQLDLMLQTDARPATFLWGQLCHAVSGRAYEGAAVTLLDAESRPLADAATDAFGEFSLAAPALVEGAVSVETKRLRFLCWIAPTERKATGTSTEGWPA